MFALASGFSGPNCRIASSYDNIPVNTVVGFEVRAAVGFEDNGGGESLGRRMTSPLDPPALAPGVDDDTVVTGGSRERPSLSADDGRRAPCASTLGSPSGAAAGDPAAVVPVRVEKECSDRAGGDGGSGDSGGLLM